MPNIINNLLSTETTANTNAVSSTSEQIVKDKPSLFDSLLSNNTATKEEKATSKTPAVTTPTKEVKTEEKPSVENLEINPEISPEIKPFTTVDFTHQTTYTNQKMLIDIGNSDGLWLFENQIENLAPLQYVFSYELGKGFNGSINGKRGVISSTNLGKYKLEFPLIAIPDIESIQYLNFKNNRKGSLGNEILRRFTMRWQTWD